MTYVIRFKGYPVHGPRPTHRVFFSRFQAETYLRKNFTSTPWDFVIDDAHWMERENHLRDIGANVPPPWVNDNALSDLLSLHHYPYRAHSDPNLLAYTPTPEMGVANRQVTTKPSRYLAKFLPNLTQRELTFFAEWFASGNRPDPNAHLKLQYATTPDEIVAVYAKGPASCMKDETAVRVYGAGDLAIAYLEEPDGKIRARALCWPTKQAFGRVYPTPDRWECDGFSSRAEAQEVFDGLTLRLKQNGWTSYLESSNVLNGARLIRTPHNDNPRYWVMPYLDGCYGFNNHPDDPAFWVMKYNGDYAAGSQCGYVTLEGQNIEDDDDDTSTSTCEHCQDGYDSSDQGDTVHDGWSPSRRSFGGEAWCQSCVERSAFWCEATDAHYADAVQGMAMMANGTTWCSDYFERYGAQCSVTGENHPLADLLTLANGERFCPDCLDDGDVYECAVSGEYFEVDDEMCRLYDDRLINGYTTVTEIDDAWFLDTELDAFVEAFRFPEPITLAEAA